MSDFELHLPNFLKIKGFFREAKINPYIKTTSKNYVENYKIVKALKRSDNLDSISVQITNLIRNLKLQILEMQYFRNSLFLLCQKSNEYTANKYRYFFLEIVIDKKNNSIKPLVVHDFNKKPAHLKIHYNEKDQFLMLVCPLLEDPLQSSQIELTFFGFMRSTAPDSRKSWIYRKFDSVISLDNTMKLGEIKLEIQILKQVQEDTN